MRQSLEHLGNFYKRTRKLRSRTVGVAVAALAGLGILWQAGEGSSPETNEVSVAETTTVGPGVLPLRTEEMIIPVIEADPALGVAEAEKWLALERFKEEYRRETVGYYMGRCLLWGEINAQGAEVTRLVTNPAAIVARNGRIYIGYTKQSEDPEIIKRYGNSPTDYRNLEFALGPEVGSGTYRQVDLEGYGPDPSPRPLAFGDDVSPFLNLFSTDEAFFSVLTLEGEKALMASVTIPASVASFDNNPGVFTAACNRLENYES